MEQSKRNEGLLTKGLVYTRVCQGCCKIHRRILWLRTNRMSEHRVHEVVHRKIGPRHSRRDLLLQGQIRKGYLPRPRGHAANCQGHSLEQGP